MQDLKVTVLLTGGHQYSFYLSSEIPLLQDLLHAIATPYGSQSRVASFFQIPIEEGRASLCFPREHLVAVITEPPITLEELGQPEIEAQEIIPSEFVQLENFLTQEEQKRLLDYVLERKLDFVPSITTTNEVDYRQSEVLYSFGKFSNLIVERIKAVLPQVVSRLGMSPINILEIESQLTAHNDGHYYRIHNDNGSNETSNRIFTYVYYFHRPPKSFSGGELLIYDSKIENNFYVEAESFQTVEPHNNSIVFFLSRYMHEVLPVSCKSKVFADSRFTINGWIRQR